jgi:hypothetical protein
MDWWYQLLMRWPALKCMWIRVCEFVFQNFKICWSWVLSILHFLKLGLYHLLMRWPTSWECLWIRVCEFVFQNLRSWGMFTFSSVHFVWFLPKVGNIVFVCWHDSGFVVKNLVENPHHTDTPWQPWLPSCHGNSWCGVLASGQDMEASM